jgi:hypothetical protein
LFFARRKISSDKGAMAMEFVEARVCGDGTARIATIFVKALVGWREKMNFFLTPLQWWENLKRDLVGQMNCPLS